MIEAVFVWLALAVIVGIAANTRGRSGPGWFLLAVIISPLIAGLLVLALPRFDNPHDGGLLVIEREREDQKRRNVRAATWVILAIAAVVFVVVLNR